MGGAGRLGVDVTVGFVIVDVTVVIVVDGLINVFVAVVERLFAVAAFAWARIWATSGEISPKENNGRVGVTVLLVIVGVEWFVDTRGIFAVVVVVVVLLLVTDVILFDTDDEVSYIYIYLRIYWF